MAANDHINLVGDTIDQSTTTIDEKVARINTKLNELENEINMLKTYYNSPAAQAIIDKYNEVNPVLKQIPDAIRNTSENINTIKNKFFRLQDELANGI